MSIRIVIVDLDSIEVPDSSIKNAAEIESLANSIIDAGGLLRLPIVYSIGVDQYKVLFDQPEIHAYKKACELDSSLPEQIDVLLVAEENKNALESQFKKLSLISSNKNSGDSGIEIYFSNLEAKISRLFTDQDNFITAQQNILLNKIEESHPKKIPMIEAFNLVTEMSICEEIHRKLSDSLNKVKANEVIILLQKAKIEGVVFKSLADLQKLLVKQNNGKLTKLIGDKKMIEIVDRWHQ